MTDSANSSPRGSEQTPYADHVAVASDAPRPLSTASLIIGFCSIAFWFTFFAPLVGLILGIIGLRKEPTGRTFALVGIWTNTVMLAIAFIGLVLLVVLLSVGIAGYTAWQGGTGSGNGYSIGS
ncbi:MAG: DUF4190 domain-containing protein [Microbacteriaceae bacterium]|nr:DUF4190 domain-containing protein [Microbacteriaceae bacterium]